MDKYYIFSDESGSWSNKLDKFYIRAWLRIKESDYFYLEGLWKTKKLPMPTEEALLKNSKNISDELGKVDIRYFFTITKLNEFYSRRFLVRDRILDSVSIAISQLESTLKSYMKKKIPSKIQDGINQIMFLNIYEAYHLDNAIAALCENGVAYEFHMDKPQFTENDYLEVFNNQVQDSAFKIIFSHRRENDANNLGICYADGLASMFNKVLNSTNSNITEYLKTKILTKTPAGNVGLNGCSKIFYPVNKSYGHEDLRGEEKTLVNSILSKLNS